ncbi:MAG TPA: hypothetical protein VFV05_16700 [Methylomirabilota bacterium]|nr:hypothetical protein [Methylomirabilota bacterium]
MNTVIRQALAVQQAAGETEVKEPSRKGLIVAGVTVAVLAIAVAGTLWLVQSPPRQPAPSAPAPVATSSTPPAQAPALEDEHRRAFETAVHSLQQLQSVSNTGNTFPFYRSRVEMMQDGVRPFLLSTAPDELRDAVRGVADIHQLASEMWSARLEDRPDALARLERSEPLRSCPAVARVLEFSDRAPGAGSARSHVLGSAIPLLWQCSGQRLGALEQRLGGR